MIAKHFKNLEKWTVGHIRALEDQVNDVERWLVDKEVEKEKEKEKEKDSELLINARSRDDMKDEIHDLQDKVVELQGQLGKLGREMAKIATVPNNLSAGPKMQSTTATMLVALQTASSIAMHSHPTSSITHLMRSLSGPSTLIHHPRLSSTTMTESTSPPMMSKRKESGMRLPYPAGDYASPPDTFSPNNSLPSSISSAMQPLSMSIPGLPLYSSSGLGTLAGASYSTTSLSSLSSSLNGGRPLSLPTQPKFVSASFHLSQ